MNFLHLYIGKNMKDFKIGNKKISTNSNPFIIAEISANHKKKIQNIFKAIDFVKANNLGALKLQTFEAQDITLNSNDKKFKIQNYFKNKDWNNRTLYDLYQEAALPLNHYKKIFDYAKKKNVICFSSIFSEDKIKFLEKFNVPAYKIASLESLHFPLIEKVAKTNKPVLISTGTLLNEEIIELIKFLKILKNHKIIIMHCNTDYPVDLKKINLAKINFLRKNSNFHLGFSDHSLGLNAAITSVSMGVVAIEKHIKISKNIKSLDSEFSLDLDDMKQYAININEAWQAIGNYNYPQSKSEKFNKKFRRSVFFSKDIKKGEKIKLNSLYIKRPLIGMCPSNIKKILGKRAMKSFKKFTPVKKDYFF